MPKCSQIYFSDDIVKNCFYSFLLPCFEYCHSALISAAESHLKLSDRVFIQIKFLLPNLDINLLHRRLVDHYLCFSKLCLISITHCTINAVKHFSTPKNVKKVRSFLSLAGYFRAFVRNFCFHCLSSHTSPQKRCSLHLA